MSWVELATFLLDVARSATGLAVNWLIQSTLLIAAGLAVGYLLRGRGSAVQSAVYRTTLVAVLVCPLATWGLSLLGVSGWSLAMPLAYSVATESENGKTAPQAEVAPLAEKAVDSGPTLGRSVHIPAVPLQAIPHISVDRSEPLQAVVVEPAPPTINANVPVTKTVFDVHRFGMAAAATGMLWIVGGVWLLCRLAVAWWHLHRLRCGARSAEPTTIEMCHEIAARLRVAPPEVLHSPYLPSPCLAGIRRPAVLLPESELSLPVRDVLVHELAHLLRHDCFWNLLRRVATAALCYQPLVWKLSSRLAATAEEVCDDYVVHFGGDRRAYAHRLVDIATLSLAPMASAGVGIVSLRSMLASRVMRILDTSRSLSTRVGSLLLAIVLVAGLTATLLVGLVGVKPSPVAADVSGPRNSDINSDNVEKPADTGDLDDAITVRGIVVGPKGAPVAGAEIYALRWFWELGKPQPLASTRSDTAGRFTITYHKSQYFGTGGRPEQWREAAIAAFADGFGPGWTSYESLAPGQEAKLRLAVDDVPIEGRIVDLEGNPLAGVRVAVEWIEAASDENLDKWIAGVRNGQSMQTTSALLNSPKLPIFSTDRWPNIVTDSDGRFRVSGLGRERLVRLHFSGNGIATRPLAVVTRRMEPLTQSSFGAGTPQLTNLGARFECTAAPSRPVEGIVRDQATGKPLSGVLVRSDPFSLEGLGGVNTIKTTTDAKGFYRLEGMLKGPGNEIHALPTEQPYFPKRINLADSPGLEAAKEDFELSRGGWVAGKVIDKKTGKPVAAKISYVPLVSNALAAVGKSQFVWSHISEDGASQTRSDGTYRIVAVPGRGLIRVDSVLEAYPSGQGYEAVAQIEQREGSPRFAGPMTPSRRSPTAFKEINVESADIETVCDFALDSGSRVTVEAVDPSGAALTDIWADGWRGRFPSPKRTESSRFDLLAFGADEVRTVQLHHKERHLGRALLLSAKENGAGVNRIRLEPCATITGRLVDGDGQPVRGVGLHIRVFRDGELDAIMARLATDSDGRFRYEQILPGLPVGIEMDRSNANDLEVVKRLDVRTGETIDLGTIDITNIKQSEMMRAAANGSQPSDKMNAAAKADAPKNPAVAAKVAKTDVDKASDKSVQYVTGQVLGPDGKPLAGATVFADWVFVGGTRVRAGTEATLKVEHEIVAKTTSDAAGEFELTFAKESPRQGQLSESWHVAAIAPGMGPDWSPEVHFLKKSSVTLRLTRGQPIRGRIVDLEGKPLAGVRVCVDEVRRATSEQVLVDWIAETKKNPPTAEMRDEQMMYAGSSSKRLAAFPVAWNDGRLAYNSLALPRDVETDKDGRFQFENIGDNRLVTLQVEGPSVAKTYVQAITREMEPLAAVPPNPVGRRTAFYFGRKFEYVADPTQPIEGTVSDADTGKPLANFAIRIHQFAGNLMSQGDFLETRTDDQGRYKLIGAPQGGGHRVSVKPPLDQPYFLTDKRLKSVTGSFDPIRCDFKLKCGRWIVGRLTENGTGKPIADTTVEYLPLRTNPHAKAFPNYDPIITGAAPSDRYRTDKDGKFRVLAIPGAGVLGAIAQYNDDRYLYAAMSGDQLPKYLVGEEDHLNTYLPWIASGYHALREVDLADSNDDAKYDLEFTHGLTRRVKIVDLKGQPVIGARVLGRVFPNTNLEEPLKESSVELIGLRANDKRLVVVDHPEKRIGRGMFVSAGEEMTVELQPCAVVRGRFVNEDGEPVSNTRIDVRIDRADNWHCGLNGSTTGADGRFEVFLPPGMTCQISHYSPPKGPNFSAECEATSGAEFELGDLKPGTKLKRDQTAKLVAAKNVNDGGKSSESVARAPIEYAGQVVLPDGKPAAGAKVFLLYWISESAGPTANMRKPLGVTDKEGRFRFSIKPGDLPGSESERSYATLAAVADGYGFAWSSADLFETSGKSLAAHRERLNGVPPEIRAMAEKMLGLVGQPLRLVEDDVPIRGRVMDINGQPVAGARFSLREVWAGESDDLTPWLEATKLKQADYYLARMTTPRSINGPMVPVLTSPVVTDSDGRFTLRGIGRERIAQLMIDGPEIQTEKMFVRTRAGETIELPDEWRRPEIEKHTYYPAEFTYIAGPSKPIVGTVRDRKTKQPLAGVEIRSQKRHGHQISGWGQDFVRTVTDKQGHYRLNGMPIGADNKIAAVAPTDQPYLAASKSANTGAAADEIKIDFELVRGVWIEGRVTDKTSGNGLVGTVEHFMFPDNPRLKGIRNLGDVDLRDRYRTDDKGHFRVPALPGRGIVGVLVEDSNRLYSRGAGAEKIAGAKSDIGTNYFQTEPHYCQPINLHALVEVNPADDAERIEVNFTLDSGGKVTGGAVDPDGHPLNDYSYSGRIADFATWEQPNADKFEVVGYDPLRPRQLVFFHKQRRLAGSLILRGPPPKDLVVKLEPAGKVTGRVVDSDGDPLGDTMLIEDRRPVASPADLQAKDEVQPSYVALPPNVTHRGSGQYATDKDGRFEVDGLVPGIEYRLRAYDRESMSPSGRMPRHSGPLDKVIVVKAGQTLDLGDLRLADESARKEVKGSNNSKIRASGEQQKVVAIANVKEGKSATASNAKIGDKTTAKVNETADPKSARPEAAQRIITGHVIGADGKPVAGAHVAAIGTRRQVGRGGDLESQDQVLDETTTDADGSYELNLSGISSQTHSRAKLIARANGTGVGWIRLDLEQANVEVSLNVTGERAIHGRLVDIEGKPAANVRMTIASMRPTSAEDKYDAGVGYYRFNVPPAAWPPPVTSDENGRFEIHGIAADQGMYIQVAESDRFAPQILALNTGMPEQRGEHDGTYRAQVTKNLKPVEEAVLALAPAQVFEGTVTYEDTGKPAPHARLTIWASQQKFGSMSSVPGKADALGHYQISPNPGIRFGVTAYPPEGVAYLARQLPEVDWEDAATRKIVDAQLPRGVLVRGKVIDSETGLPVSGASIQYIPEEANNRHAADDILTGWQGIQPSHKDGSFEIAVLPGPGWLVVHGPQGEFVVKESTTRALNSGRAGGTRCYANAFQRLDPPAQAGPIELVFKLDRAQKVRGKLVDEQGQPISKAVVISRLITHPHLIEWRGDLSIDASSGQFELPGLARDQETRVYFLDADRRLGASADLKADGQTTTVTLKPCGQAVARFMDGEGEPLANYSPSLQMVVTPGASRDDVIGKSAMKAGITQAEADFVSNIDRKNYWPGPRTDSEGRITFPALIAGATYQILKQGGSKEFTVDSNQTVDLGKFVIDRRK